MKKTVVEINKIQVPGEFIFLKKAIKAGNGAIIPFFKRFEGEEVYVIIKSKCK